MMGRRVSAETEGRKRRGTSTRCEGVLEWRVPIAITVNKKSRGKSKKAFLFAGTFSTLHHRLIHVPPSLE